MKQTTEILIAKSLKEIPSLTSWERNAWISPDLIYSPNVLKTWDARTIKRVQRRRIHPFKVLPNPQPKIFFTFLIIEWNHENDSIFIINSIWVLNWEGFVMRELYTISSGIRAGITKNGFLKAPFQIKRFRTMAHSQFSTGKRHKK